MHNSEIFVEFLGIEKFSKKSKPIYFKPKNCTDEQDEQTQQIQIDFLQKIQTQQI